MPEEVQTMEVLVTGGETELGRAIAQGFHDAGHQLTLVGAPGVHADELEALEALEAVAEELDAKTISCDNTDPASLIEARGLFPHHLDTIVNVPAPRWGAGDPPTYSSADSAEFAEFCRAWRNALNATVLSAALTVQTVGDHLRSGGSIISVVPENPRDGSADGAAKAALSNWTAGQATVFGTRGITVNVVASGSGSGPGYDGLADTAPTVAAEIARIALFLTTPAARHITGQTLHIGHRALARFG